MRISWFANSSSLFNVRHYYNGGGCIAPLHKGLKAIKNIELAITFIGGSTINNKIDGTTFFRHKVENNESNKKVV